MSCDAFANLFVTATSTESKFIADRVLTGTQPSHVVHLSLLDNSVVTMPYWSIAEWRARIGSSWCALARPVKSKSSFRCRTGWIRRVLTMNQVVTIMIMMIMLIRVNFGLHSIISGGYYHPLTSERPATTAHCAQQYIYSSVFNSSYYADLLQVGAVSSALYFLNLDCLLSSALRNCTPLLYQLFPIIIKQSVKQLCSDLIKTLYFSSCILHRLLFLIHLLVYPILWLIIYGMRYIVTCVGKGGGGISGREGEHQLFQFVELGHHRVTSLLSTQSYLFCGRD